MIHIIKKKELFQKFEYYIIQISEMNKLVAPETIVMLISHFCTYLAYFYLHVHLAN